MSCHFLRQVSVRDTAKSASTNGESQLRLGFNGHRDEDSQNYHVIVVCSLVAEACGDVLAFESCVLSGTESTSERNFRLVRDMQFKGLSYSS
ncbi:hypothetical protein TNIN_361271 [Trichonephila inaurata madagascariensis]|uniref:Uncharacterized protein n=1 Tax=Trichonephila inaurata madagascariensis TaxID=2747483 RepID=A0A8X7BWV3_9ARAC|nr:hypothetical protein TNIN_361271 [Trichonephila inaurata madagascariensis]